MEYGISHLAIVPLRAEPNERSEQVSQVLFGEIFEVKEWAERWVKIVTTLDHYEGWINRIQFVPLDEVAYVALKDKNPVLTNIPLTQVLKKSDLSNLYLPIGSNVSFLTDNDTFELNRLIPPKDTLINTAHSFLNTPYLWGGRTHFGVDCSGFVQCLYRLQGINLLRDARQQAEQGELVDFLQSSKPGDLAFFDNAEGNIIHVGLMLNNEQIIHASGRVKIDKIDDHGIYSQELGRYTHQLRIIKRF